MLIYEQVDRVAGMAFPYAGRFMPHHGTTMSTNVGHLPGTPAGGVNLLLPPAGGGSCRSRLKRDILCK